VGHPVKSATLDDPNQLDAARDVHWDDLALRIAGDTLTALRADEAFMNSATARAQCYHACRILRSDTPPSFPSALISRILGIDRGAVKRHFKKGLSDPGDTPRNGRPSILGTEQRRELGDAIHQRYAARRPTRSPKSTTTCGPDSACRSAGTLCATCSADAPRSNRG
jgi:hypothetical protein